MPSGCKSVRSGFGSLNPNFRNDLIFRSLALLAVPHGGAGESEQSLKSYVGQTQENAKVARHQKNQIAKWLDVLLGPESCHRQDPLARQR